MKRVLQTDTGRRPDSSLANVTCNLSLSLKVWLYLVPVQAGLVGIHDRHEPVDTQSAIYKIRYAYAYIKIPRKHIQLNHVKEVFGINYRI